MKRSGWLKNATAVPRGYFMATAPKQESRKDPVLTEMTKDELEDLGREHGVELDKRKAKGSLIKTIKKALK